ncbi:hypothetical protein GF325_00960 [Candidatus Bathyarchaeota archaeon]|nr:hypothetical protein [Candidatus Bathyarchaeota archaeon]
MNEFDMMAFQVTIPEQYLVASHLSSFLVIQAVNGGSENYKFTEEKYVVMACCA